MSIITLILAGIVALEHLYIMYLETFATHSDTTSRVFNMSKEELQRDSVTNLFKNQGIYKVPSHSIVSPSPSIVSRCTKHQVKVKVSKLFIEIHH